MNNWWNIFGETEAIYPDPVREDSEEQDGSLAGLGVPGSGGHYHPHGWGEGTVAGRILK